MSFGAAKMGRAARTISVVVTAAAWLAGCSRGEDAAVTPVASKALTSGLNAAYFDTATRPQDDLYRHINGKWLDATEIPADKARYGAFYELDDLAQMQLQEIVESLQQNPSLSDADAIKVRDVYASFMNEARLETLGVTPLQTALQDIDQLKTATDIANHLARLVQLGVNVPVVPYVHQDNKDSTKYVVDLYQAGLGLPDRDYYLKTDDANFSKIREAYRQHIDNMFALAGLGDGAAAAQQVLTLETALAKAHWDKVVNRDPVKTYNKFALTQLRNVAPRFDWSAYLDDLGVSGKVDYLLISQPSYVSALARLLEQQPVKVWQTYLKWKLLSGYAEYLSKSFVDEDFNFSSKTLRDIPENRPRWKRGLDVVETSVGESLGKQYVARHFPAENKQRMEQLVSNLMTAYRQSIDGLEWMSAATKEQAREKLAKFTVKIGYPDTWRDYSTLVVKADDLVGNIMRARQFEYQRNINKLGKPIDRAEWGMTPQTVNAYYNPELNEIVFPAAILQPPFFNAAADDAVNYGGIGAVIGHEISHGFDDQGSQYDGDGNLRDWWSKEDHEKFSAKTRALVAQYAAYEPIKGYHINGELTLGENIADLSGLAIAHKAYLLSMDGKQDVVLDGLTGEQRFFAGWAQVWRGKTREKEEIRRLTVDVHSPMQYRALGATVNQNAFYSAFEVKDTDQMYLKPEQRVSIW